MRLARSGAKICGIPYLSQSISVPLVGVIAQAELEALNVAAEGKAAIDKGRSTIRRVWGSMLKTPQYLSRPPPFFFPRVPIFPHLFGSTKLVREASPPMPATSPLERWTKG